MNEQTKSPFDAQREFIESLIADNDQRMQALQQESQRLLNAHNYLTAMKDVETLTAQSNKKEQ